MFRLRHTASHRLRGSPEPFSSLAVLRTRPNACAATLCGPGQRSPRPVFLAVPLVAVLRRTLLLFTPGQLKLIIDSIVWAFRHTERNVAETGLNLLQVNGRAGWVEGGLGGPVVGGGQALASTSCVTCGWGAGSGWLPRTWALSSTPPPFPMRRCSQEHDARARLVPPLCRGHGRFPPLHPIPMRRCSRARDARARLVPPLSAPPQDLLQQFSMSQFATQFYQTYYLQLLQEIFAVLTGAPPYSPSRPPRPRPRPRATTHPPRNHAAAATRPPPPAALRRAQIRSTSRASSCTRASCTTSSTCSRCPPPSRRRCGTRPQRAPPRTPATRPSSRSTSPTCWAPRSPT